MTRTLMISATAAALLAGVWTFNLVTYHPAGSGLNPLAPIGALATGKQ
jgi:hypothetical protein